MSHTWAEPGGCSNLSEDPGCRDGVEAGTVVLLGLEDGTQLSQSHTRPCWQGLGEQLVQPPHLGERKEAQNGGRALPSHAKAPCHTARSATPFTQAWRLQRLAEHHLRARRPWTGPGRKE